jgi:hypothetical protein
MNLKAPLFAVFILLTASFAAGAEMYRYTDERGQLHITDNLASVPESQRPRKTAPSVSDDNILPKQRTVDASPEKSAPAQHVPVQDASKQSAPAPPEAHPEQPRQIITINTGTQHDLSAIDHLFASTLQHMLEEKFKDVKDPSKRLAESVGSPVDCTNHKRSMKEDIVAMDALMKDVNERKRRGESEFMLKLRAIRGLKYLVNIIYNAAVVPEQCQAEFERENKELLESFGK